MKNLLILLGILLSSPFVVAQHSAINGNVAIANNSPEGTRVVVIKNGNKLDEQVLNKKGHFDLKLAFDADYKISFEKTGYITKIISINTEVPEESIENNPDFPPVKLIINLLPSVEKIDLSIFDQPIAILTYQAELDDFTFDKSYSDKIKDRIAQTEQAVKKQLAARDAAAIEQERKFAELFNKGLESFGRKAWQAAIDSWTLAQNMKPGNKEVKQKIAEAQEQAKLEEARKSVEPQNEQTYRLLLAAADSLFSREEYPAAKEKYASAKQIKTKEPYPQEQIRNIDRLLAEIAQKEAITQQQLAEAEATYQKTIAQADRSYQAQEYRHYYLSAGTGLKIGRSLSPEYDRQSRASPGSPGKATGGRSRETTPGRRKNQDFKTHIHRDHSRSRPGIQKRKLQCGQTTLFRSRST